MRDEQMPGGWEYHTDELKPCDLSRHVSKVFDIATSKIVGVTYEPLLYVASQVVGGTNYCIVCKSSTTLSHPPLKSCKTLYIFEDLSGDAEVTKVEEVVH